MKIGLRILSQPIFCLIETEFMSEQEKRLFEIDVPEADILTFKAEIVKFFDNQTRLIEIWKRHLWERKT